MCRYTKAPETQTALVLNSGGKGKANFSLLPSTYYVRVLVLPASLASDSRHHFLEEGNAFSSDPFLGCRRLSSSSD